MSRTPLLVGLVSLSVALGALALGARKPVEKAPFVQCQAITTKGKRCRRVFKADGNPYCFQHRALLASQVPKRAR